MQTLTRPASETGSRAEFLVAGARQYWAVGAYWLLAVALMHWLGFDAFTTRLVTYLTEVDYWEHSAALRALIDAPLSPGHSHLDSDSLSPRYNPLFVAIALVARAFGLDALGAMGIAAYLNAALFLGGVHWFFALYFRDRRAPLYAFFVLLTSWWFGWPYSNVYQLQMLRLVASYPSTAALGLSWLCFGLATRLVRSGPTRLRLALMGLLCSLVLLVHPLTAMLALCGSASLAVFEPGARLRTRLWVLASMLVGVTAAYLWPYYSVFDVLSGGSNAKTAGWAGRAAAQLLSGAAREPQRAFYDAGNLLGAVGLAAPGLLFAVAMVRHRRHLFVPIGMSCMLAIFIANLRIPLPLGHRYVLLAMLFLHIATVWGWLRLSPGYHDASPLVARPWAAPAAMLALAIVFGVGAWHNLDLVANQARQLRGSQTASPVVEYARQVSERAGEDAVILGPLPDSWPLPTFGPKIVAMHHVDPLVPDGAERVRDVGAFFNRDTSDATRDALLRKYSVTHVLSTAGDAKVLDHYLGQRATSEDLVGGFRLSTLPRAR